MNITTSKGEQILDVFSAYRMGTTPIDEWDKGGREVLLEKINSFVSNNQQIEFAMLGFPFKSANNRDKVIGNLPDLGEEVAFQNFGNFHNHIKAIYTPGARITVVSDGPIFNDILDVDDRVVAGYHEVNMDFAKQAGVQLLTLQDFFGGKTTLNTMREKVMTNFGITPELLQQRILMDVNVNELYRGISRFMAEELAIRDYPSGNQRKVAAKQLARVAMMRNEAYSQFMAAELSARTPYIRLSMHHSTNNGTKYSFQMIPGTKAWSSPWHCAIALDNAEYVTIHKKDAEAQGYELVYKNGRPYFYQGSMIVS